jgi:hypothetical protein
MRMIVLHRVAGFRFVSDGTEMGSCMIRVRM